jgi:hypothetical protein
MTDHALAISFVDRERDVHGTARSGLTLLFEGGNASSHEQGPAVEQRGEAWHAEAEGLVSLDFSPIAPAVEVGGTRAHLVSARGTAGESKVDGLGVVSEILSPPRWDELDAHRALFAMFDRQNAFVLIARRPRDAQGHGEELVTAQLLTAGELKAVEDARLSTIYDGDGRPRSASLELWLPGEDFPRRAFGHVAAGASLALDGLEVHAGRFEWRMEAMDGAGIYELTVRTPTPAAA